MKLNSRLHAGWLCLAALFLTLIATFAERLQIGILIEYYEVDFVEVPKLLRDYQDQPDGTDLVGLLRDRAEKGEVRLVESGYILTRSGQRAKIESIREWIYPTEFDPPEIPQKLTGPIEPGVVLTTNANPTAFELRPVGSSIEVDPVIGAGGHYVTLNIAPELVEYHGERIWGQDESVTKQPIFRASDVTTALTLRKGRSELLGVFSPQKDSPKRVLGFVTPMVHEAIDQKTHDDPPQEDPEKQDEDLPADDPFADGAGKPADDEGVDGGPRQLSVITEFIEMDALVANKLVLAINTISDASAQRRQLDALIEAGAARMIETSSVITLSGQRSKFESVEEYTYPTEYDPPEIPQELTGPIALGVDFVTANGATAFETRPVGTTVEVDPVLSNKGDVIDINIAPEIVKFVRDLEHGSETGLALQPLFETIKLTTAATVPNGATILLGMHGLETARAAEAGTKAEQDEVRGRRVLVFLSVTRKAP